MRLEKKTIRNQEPERNTVPVVVCWSYYNMPAKSANQNTVGHGFGILLVNPKQNLCSGGVLIPWCPHPRRSRSDLKRVFYRGFNAVVLPSTSAILSPFVMLLNSLQPSQNATVSKIGISITNMFTPYRDLNARHTVPDRQSTSKKLLPLCGLRCIKIWTDRQVVCSFSSCGHERHLPKQCALLVV